MRLRLRSIAIVTLGLGLGAVFVVYVALPVLGYLFYSGPDLTHHSDARMRAAFMARQADFEVLRGMFEADTAFDRIDTPTYAIPHAAHPPIDRQERYEELMSGLGIRNIVREGPDLFILRATTTHTFDRKGYAWSRRPLATVSHETTRMTRDETYRGVFRVFRPLKDGWYIYFQPIS